MSIMHQFKLANVTPKKGSSAVERFRHKMTDAIELQIDIAKADAAGQAFTRLQQRWVRTDKNGDKELRNVPIPIRRWWWTDDKGVTYVTVKHNAKPIELAPGKNAIEIGSLAELADKLALLRDAVRAGELDAQAKSEKQMPIVSKKVSAPPSKSVGGKA